MQLAAQTSKPFLIRESTKLTKPCRFLSFDGQRNNHFLAEILLYIYPGSGWVTSSESESLIVQAWVLRNSAAAFWVHKFFFDGVNVDLNVDEHNNWNECMLNTSGLIFISYTLCHNDAHKCQLVYSFTNHFVNLTKSSKLAFMTLLWSLFTSVNEKLWPCCCTKQRCGTSVKTRNLLAPALILQPGSERTHYSSCSWFWRMASGNRQLVYSQYWW